MCIKSVTTLVWLIYSRLQVSALITIRPKHVAVNKRIKNSVECNLLDTYPCDLLILKGITLVYLQLDAQNSYLFTYNTFIKILYMFRALSCSSLGGLRRNCINAASGIVTLCRWLSCAPVKKEFLFSIANRHDWLTVHRSITLVDLNLMHKILVYLYIIHLLKSSTCFEHSAYLQEVYVVIVYMQPMVSSLSLGDCLVHRLRKKFYLNPQVTNVIYIWSTHSWCF